MVFRFGPTGQKKLNCKQRFEYVHDVEGVKSREKGVWSEGLDVDLTRFRNYDAGCAGCVLVHYSRQRAVLFFEQRFGVDVELGLL